VTGKERAQISVLPDGRLHLNDGPIDLVIQATGDPPQVRAAYRAASLRFVEVLDELCAELPLLRSAACAVSPNPIGRIAQRMMAAVRPYADEIFLTPMAAVAGSVAEDVLAVMVGASKLRRASVNNGGDIALFLAEGESFHVGMAAGVPSRLDAEELAATFRIASEDAVRGIATSGWPGRSFSLGIADAVTVLAATASMADAAATVIGNAVDLPGNPAILRVPACEISPDSDLGARAVTRHVGKLTAGEVAEALHRGRTMAEQCRSRGLITAAALSLQGRTDVVQPITAHLPGADPFRAHLEASLA
jgi:ApbE superfamily uncharacterized protein (UPF0280 family)